MKKSFYMIGLLVLQASLPVASEPVSGVVFGISDAEIEILISTGKPPSEGMPVEVFTEDGESVGRWVVARMEINTVFARPVEISGTPQLGQKVIIGKLKPAVDAPTVSPVEAVAPVVVAPVVSPTETVAPVAVAPVASKPPPKVLAEITKPLSAADQVLMDDLASGNSARIRNAAKYLYRGRYEDPVVMDKAAEVLQQQFNLKPRDAMHVDGMAWICKALWVSGEEKYLPVLRVVESQSNSPKLRKYAVKYRAALERKVR